MNPAARPPSRGRGRDLQYSSVKYLFPSIPYEERPARDNKIDRILKEFDYLRDSVSNMKEENKHYYDSLSAKIHLFYFMFIVFSIWIIWSI